MWIGRFCYPAVFVDRRLRCIMNGICNWLFIVIYNATFQARDLSFFRSRVACAYWRPPYRDIETRDRELQNIRNALVGGREGVFKFCSHLSVLMRGMV